MRKPPQPAPPGEESVQRQSCKKPRTEEQDTGEESEKITVAVLYRVMSSLGIARDIGAVYSVITGIEVLFRIIRFVEAVDRENEPLEEHG